MNRCANMSLEDRVEMLEIECRELRQTSRRWKRIGLVTLCGGLGLMFCGAQLQNEDTVRAKSFRLIDRNGRPAAAFELTPEGLPLLAFWDRQGDNRVKLGMVGEASPGLVMYDAGACGKQRIRIGVDPKGNGTVSLHKDDKARFVVICLNDGSVALSASGSKSKSAVALGIEKDEAPFVIVQGIDGASVFRAPGR